MIGAIPNPTRSITLNYPVNEVADVLNDLALIHSHMNISGYEIKEKDSILNQWKISKGEFLSLGAIILVQLEELGEKTKVNIEVTRALGAYDNWVEVNNANKHLDVILKSISFGLNPPSQEEISKIQQTNQTENNSDVFASVVVVVLIAFTMFSIL